MQPEAGEIRQVLKPNFINLNFNTMAKIIAYGIQIQETEKAIKVELKYKHLQSEKTNTWTTWMPKSVSNFIDKELFGNKGIEIQSWFAEKLANEICTKTGMGHFGSRILTSIY